ncbi:hypothetical protein EDB87DRAFT_1609282 [Lactarius vividus]|nr:hypothetical protein EDB87DRAFT_1609282 [Lactarius vividus]
MVPITIQTSPFPSYFFFCLHLEHIMRMRVGTQRERMHAILRLAAHLTRTQPTYHLCPSLFFFCSVLQVGKIETPLSPFWAPGKLPYCVVWASSPDSPPFPLLLYPLSFLYLCSGGAVRPLNKITPRPPPFRPPGTPLPLLADGLGWIRYPCSYCGVLSAPPFFELRIPHSQRRCCQVNIGVATWLKRTSQAFFFFFGLACGAPLERTLSGVVVAFARERNSNRPGKNAAPCVPTMWVPNTQNWLARRDEARYVA